MKPEDEVRNYRGSIAAMDSRNVENVTNLEKLEQERQRFEAWITSSPYEREINRWPMDETKHAWPGQYCDINVQLAWEAWCEALRMEM